jgi:class III poly(R)-hydroxyalkanoic acid synthase PhaE subunit
MTDPGLQHLLEKVERAQLDFTEILRKLSDIQIASTSGGWAEPLDKWWAGVRTDADPEVVALYEKLVEHGHVLFRLAEHLGTSPKKGDKRPDLTLLREFQQGLGDGLTSAASHTTGIFSPMSHLMDTWLNQVEPLLGVPGSPSGKFSKPDQAQDSFTASIRSLLDPLPAISSHDRRRLRELVDAMLDYQTHLNRFTKLAIRATADAAARMEARGDLKSDRKRIGVREFYTAWLECCEETYDELAREDEFIETLGALFNSAVRLRTVRQRLADASAKAAGMPSRGEMRELAGALQQMRRRVGPSKPRRVAQLNAAQNPEEGDGTINSATDNEKKRASTARAKVVKKKFASKESTARKPATKKPATKKSTAKKGKATAATKKTTGHKKASRTKSARKRARGGTGG